MKRARCLITDRSSEEEEEDESLLQSQSNCLTSAIAIRAVCTFELQEMLKGFKEMVCFSKPNLLFHFMI